MPTASRVDEILVNRPPPRALRLHVGSEYHASVFNVNELSNTPRWRIRRRRSCAKYFTPVDLRVVGIGRGADELLSNQNQDQAYIMLTPAFARRYPEKVSYAFAGVELRHGQRDIPAFETALRGGVARRTVPAHDACHTPRDVSQRRAAVCRFAAPLRGGRRARRIVRRRPGTDETRRQRRRRRAHPRRARRHRAASGRLARPRRDRRRARRRAGGAHGDRACRRCSRSGPPAPRSLIPNIASTSPWSRAARS